MKHHHPKPYLDPCYRDVFDGHCVVELSEDEPMRRSEYDDPVWLERLKFVGVVIGVSCIAAGFLFFVIMKDAK